ncbi:MAG: DRTGG domain-containing protein [Anaerolineae bacterium]|jgi:hypothetical protein
MTVREVAEALGLEVLTPPSDGSLDRQVRGGYASDLLSCAMAGAKRDEAWVTLQSHRNVVAVASLTEVACVILTEGARPDEETIALAQREGVTLLSTSTDTFNTVAGLVRLGVPG